MKRDTFTRPLDLGAELIVGNFEHERALQQASA
ncbi:hypothetical protein HDG38_002270 [Paraburkholderia sp. WSM4177]|nr:hypothetical protein [Paraburkholderia sp. WSM4177]MBB5484120.1 hypothetical protein [Paraburkholderia sp. WSM4180]